MLHSRGPASSPTAPSLRRPRGLYLEVVSWLLRILDAIRRRPRATSEQERLAGVLQPVRRRRR
jgi:hypothetical protein